MDHPSIWTRIEFSMPSGRPSSKRCYMRVHYAQTQPHIAGKPAPAPALTVYYRLSHIQFNIIRVQGSKLVYR